jgi:hypothetical protein
MGFRNPPRVLDGSYDPLDQLTTKVLPFRGTTASITATSWPSGVFMELDPGAGGPRFQLVREDAPAGGKRNAVRFPDADVVVEPAYVVQAVQTTAQPLANGAWVPMAFQSTAAADGGLNAGGFGVADPTFPSRIVVPVDGYYRADGIVHMAGAAGARRGVRWNWTDFTTGNPVTPRTAVAAFEANPANAIVAIPCRSIVVKLRAGGWIEMQALQDSGGSVSTFLAGDSATNASVQLLAAL